MHFDNKMLKRHNMATVRLLLTKWRVNGSAQSCYVWWMHRTKWRRTGAVCEPKITLITWCLGNKFRCTHIDSLKNNNMDLRAEKTSNFFRYDIYYYIVIYIHFYLNIGSYTIYINNEAVHSTEELKRTSIHFNSIYIESEISCIALPSDYSAENYAC